MIIHRLFLTCIGLFFAPRIARRLSGLLGIVPRARTGHEHLANKGIFKIREADFFTIFNTYVNMCFLWLLLLGSLW